MSKSFIIAIAIITAMLACTNATAQQADNFPTLQCPTRCALPRRVPCT